MPAAATRQLAPQRRSSRSVKSKSEVSECFVCFACVLCMLCVLVLRECWRPSKMPCVRPRGASGDEGLSAFEWPRATKPSAAVAQSERCFRVLLFRLRACVWQRLTRLTLLWVSFAIRLGLFVVGSLPCTQGHVLSVNVFYSFCCCWNTSCDCCCCSSGAGHCFVAQASFESLALQETRRSEVLVS